MNESFSIWAVGRNYADHAKELGNTVPQPASEPMIFLKAGSCSVETGREIRLPSWSNDVHHELEIAVRFGDDLQFSHFAAALDLTARDVQARLKAQGSPWTLAKSFTDSCPLGKPVAMTTLKSDFESLEFELIVNHERRQLGHTRDMIFKLPQLNAYVRERFPVRPGDWLLTGTPAGVSALRSGDVLEASIKNYTVDRWTVR